MYLKIKNSRLLKGISVFSALNLMFQIFYPTAAYALTSGPTQPEVQSFEPVGTNQMVDLFTGNFNYNIPLLNVPGPNGGYPINMAYHAGISMEQEASWVGLGWNINPGVINRQMRGLPDDFDGATVTKEYYTRPQEGWMATLQANTEFMGEETSIGLGLTIGNNNYTGVSGGFSVSTNPGEGSLGSGNLGLSLDYNSNSGAGLSLSTSVGFQGYSASNSLNYTENGLQSVSSSVGMLIGYKGSGVKSRGVATHSFGAKFFTPSSTFPTTTSSERYLLGVGYTAAATSWEGSLMGEFNESGLKETTLEFDSYGYMYSENSDDESLMDFMRENDGILPTTLSSLPTPVYTYDTYQVLGQGIGSVFRPHRSDAGYLHDPLIHSGPDNSGFGAELEVSVGVSEASGGGQYGEFYHESYSGPWRNMYEEENSTDLFNNHFKFHKKSDILAATAGQRDGTLYDPFYMRSTSDQAAWAGSSLYDQSEGAFAFPLGGTYVSSKLRATIANPLYPHIHKNRSRQEESMFMSTFGDLKDVNRGDYYNLLEHHEVSTYEELIDLSIFDEAKIESQIAEITAYSSDGMRYVYALPAFNTTHKQVVFAVDDPTINPTSGGDGLDENNNLFDYTPEDHVKKENGKGLDSYFSRNTTPAFSHAHFLSAIYSDDYVDLKGDGPSEDDLGYYVNFKYEKTPDLFKWRAPFYDADYIHGARSNFLDNKANYTYGEREQYYVSSVETKTHIAKFILSDRNDGFGVTQEHQEDILSDSDNATGQKKLDRIDLYSKNNLLTPIKSAHFEYDYSLCKGVFNYKNIDSYGDPTKEAGKLTLKKVYFTYGNSMKSALSPYQFEYSEHNPDYSVNQSDRWGFYKEGEGIANRNFPYVDQREQNSVQRQIEAEAWNLTSIQLPSGAEMNIEYEKDDYKTVQNKKAMQACKVIAVGTSSVSDFGLTSYNIDTSQRNYVYFEMNEDPAEITNGAALAGEYVAGVDNLYFKMYMYLKDHPDDAMGGYGGDVARDYVEGYAEVDPTSPVTYQVVEKTDADGNTYDVAVGRFKMKAVPIGSSYSTRNPMQKAAIQEIKLKRSDLRTAPDTNGVSVEDILEIFDIIDDFTALMLGYYNFAVYEGYGETIYTYEDNPSIVRLNTPGNKYGGGYRVKRISVNDNWDDMTADAEEAFSYGQEFFYSEGNAEYEPEIGNEENPLRQPIRQSATDLITKDDALYAETPFGEMFYPGANVGYGKVVVRNLVRDEEMSGDTRITSKSGVGITEHKFYTSKDFPVQVDLTPLTGVNYVKIQQNNEPDPFGVTLELNNRAYSQGYEIRLNNMHGQARSTTTYPDHLYSFSDGIASVIDESIPFSQQNKYYYNCTNDAGDPVTSLAAQRLKTLYPDGHKEHSHLGRTVDFYTETREDYTVTEHSADDVSLGGGTTPFYLFGYTVSSDKVTENLFRSIVANKIIAEKGVLRKSISDVNGAKSITEHMLFDSETGDPVLTRVRNEFGRYIYNKSYPAHKEYAQMGGAYKNLSGEYLTSTYTVSPGKIDFSFNPQLSSTDLFVPGDELEVKHTTSGVTYIYQYWVMSVDETSADSYDVQLEDIKGTNSIATGEDLSIKVIRSGYRNLMSINAGSKIYMEGAFPLAEQLNSSSGTISSTEIPIGRLKNCDDITIGEPFMKAATHNKLAFRLELFDDPDDCIGAYMQFPEEHNFYDPNYAVLADYSFKKVDDIIYVKIDNVPDGEGGTETIYTKADWVDFYDCFEVCELILNASAVEFDNGDWNLPYREMSDFYVESDGTFPIYEEVLNPYRYGKKGIWHPKKSHTYVTKREQSKIDDIDYHSDIAVDGHFDEFTEYDWTRSRQKDSNWQSINETTRYSPYGFELESKNPLGIYSSALYGYNGSSEIAVAVNAKYNEIAFVGFEEDIAIDGDYYTAGHLRLHIGGTSQASISDDYAHTGKRSIKISTGDGTGDAYGGNALWATITPTTEETNRINPEQSKEYVVSTWVKAPEASSDTDYSKLVEMTVIHQTSSGNVGLAYMSTFYSKSPMIDGWRKMEVKFTMPEGDDPVKIRFGGKYEDGFTYFDDIRIYPFDAHMKNYVYDKEQLRLLAELDVQNYATFYNYDNAGNLVQVKKETVDGIKTIKATRENTSN